MKKLGALELEFCRWVKRANLNTFEIKDLCNNLSLDSKKSRELLYRLNKKELVKRITKGFYATNPEVLMVSLWNWYPTPQEALMAIMKNKNATYQVTGLAAYNYYYWIDQIALNFSVYNDKINRTINYDQTQIVFIKKDKSFLNNIQIANSGLSMPTKAKAIFDVLSDKNLNTYIRKVERWLSELEKKEIMEFIECVKSFGTDSVIRRAGYLLDKSNAPTKLTLQLKNYLKYKNIIPLVKTRKSIGEVNRKWGVVDNL